VLIAVSSHISTGADYSYNKSITGVMNGYPLGMGIEVISLNALERLNRLCKGKQHREHVTLFILQNKQMFKTNPVGMLKPAQLNPRLVLDTREDYELLKKLYAALYRGRPITTDEVLSYIEKHPWLLEINAGVKEATLELIENA